MIDYLLVVLFLYIGPIRLERVQFVQNIQHDLISDCQTLSLMFSLSSFISHHGVLGFWGFGVLG